MMTMSEMTTPTIPMAAADPSSFESNACEYRSMTSVSVAPTGPPLVINQISSNRRSDQIVISRASRPTVGLMTCQVTARKVAHRPAPSTVAASLRSCGTDWRAESSTTEVNGNSCQMVVASTAGSA